METDLNEIYRLTAEGMMGMAMNMLKRDKQEMPYWLQSQYENVEMLLRQYYLYQDKAMTARVKGAVLELTDDIGEWMAGKTAIRYEHSIRRNWHISNETLLVALEADYDTTNGISIEMDAQLVVMFRQIWLSGKLDGNAIQALRTFVTGDGHDFARKMAVSAIMLRCIRYYDARLVEVLMESRTAEACVAVVMIAMAQQKRIDCDEQSLELYSRYMADGENVERCMMVYNNVMRTFETQNIASEMREKIFPIVKEQGMKFREGSQDIRLFDENGLNPEWEEKLEDSGIMDKMRRINDLQMSGADIHYESFQMMKSTPFFMETAHWFYPFDIRYHQLEGMEGEEDKGLGEISRLINLCDSDRYSLFFMLKGMGVGGLRDALGNLGLGNFDEVREQLGEDEKWKETMKVSFATEVRFAVMNLYRFYNLAPNHSDMTSPFARVMPAEGSRLGYTTVPARVRYMAANLLFKARQWDIAHEYYRSTVDEYLQEDPMIYQKMGYCRERTENWKEAIDEYGKSDIIVPDDIWTMRHTACCHLKAGDIDMAAGMYRKVLDMDMENTDAIDNLADIYMEAEDYADAKPLLYKLEYTRGSYRDIRRLGHCLFMLGERAEATTYLDKACFDHEHTTNLDSLKHAIAVGDNEELYGEACIYNVHPEETMALLGDKETQAMLSRLTAEERDRIMTVINKKILEQ